ncbi:MAG TPA: SDR family NAD(P)-dependent oxidoreductase, partial [Kribbella sp.]
MAPESAPRTVVVTGGAAGIGRGAVERFVAAGDRVIALDRDAEALAALERELGGSRAEDAGRVGRVQVDVSDRAALASAAEQIGAVDVLVCAAGVQRYGTVVDTPYSVYDEVMAV